MMDVRMQDIARVAHEVNRAYCQATQDLSQVPWDQAPFWQRDSAISGVEFHILNPTAPASASHESWLNEKRSQGWSYGPVKDVEKKLHPCCVPYDQLPVYQQVKDHLFKAVVKAMLMEERGPHDIR